LNQKKEEETSVVIDTSKWYKNIELWQTQGAQNCKATDTKYE